MSLHCDILTREARFTPSWDAPAPVVETALTIAQARSLVRRARNIRVYVQFVPQHNSGLIAITKPAAFRLLADAKVVPTMRLEDDGWLFIGHFRMRDADHKGD